MLAFDIESAFEGKDSFGIEFKLIRFSMQELPLIRVHDCKYSTRS